jgi:hypothetical protein
LIASADDSKIASNNPNKTNSDEGGGLIPESMAIESRFKPRSYLPFQIHDASRGGENGTLNIQGRIYFSAD